MKAVYIAEPGGPEKLLYGDRPDAEAGPGDVIVRVRATALNHADLALRAGRSATGGLPRILGLDIAGEIASVGPGVTGWKSGDRVVVENRVKCGTCTPCVHGRDEFWSVGDINASRPVWFRLRRVRALGFRGNPG